METPPREGTVSGPGEAESHNSDRPPSPNRPQTSLCPTPVPGPPPQSLPSSQCSGFWWSRPTGGGAQPASRLIPGSAGSRRPTPQRTDAGAAQPPRVPSPRSASPRSQTAPRCRAQGSGVSRTRRSSPGYLPASGTWALRCRLNLLFQRRGAPNLTAPLAPGLHAPPHSTPLARRRVSPAPYPLPLAAFLPPRPIGSLLGPAPEATRCGRGPE